MRGERGLRWGTLGPTDPLDGASANCLHQSPLVGEGEKAGDKSVPGTDGTERN